MLRDRAREAGATIIQGAQIIDVRQDSSGVSVAVEYVDGGNMRELRAEYLIAADGGHSKVRECLGIGYEGRGAFSNSVTIYFTADVSPWVGNNAWSVIYVNNPVLRGFFRLNRSAQAGFLAINAVGDRKSTRLNSSHSQISYAVFCLKKKKNDHVKSADLPC